MVVFRYFLLEVHHFGIARVFGNFLVAIDDFFYDFVNFIGDECVFFIYFASRVVLGAFLSVDGEITRNFRGILFS